MSRKSEAHEKMFRDFLRQRGMRFTGEREAILHEVLTRKGHFDPEGLFAALREGGKKASRASVYRTLPLMAAAGIVAQVERTDKQSRYECIVAQRHHDHMLCLQCGKVVEFYSEDLENLQARLCQNQKFTGIDHSLEITGYCKECQGERRTPPAGRGNIRKKG